MRIKELEKLFKSLGNRRRLKIIKLLLIDNELTVSDIAKELKISIKAASKHLLNLFNSEVLEREQKWKSAYYKVADNHESLLKNLINHIYHSSE